MNLKIQNGEMKKTQIYQQNWLTSYQVEFQTWIFDCRCNGVNCSLELTAVSNEAWLWGWTLLGTNCLESIKDRKSIDDPTEDDVRAIEPLGLDERQEELRSVRTGSSVRHRKISSSGVFQIEVLICKLQAIDGLSSSTISSGEISTLSHEIFDDTMEWWSLVAKWLSRFTHALLTSAKGSEVLSSLWHLVSVQLNDDSASQLLANGDIKENVWVCHLNKYVFYYKFNQEFPF